MRYIFTVLLGFHVVLYLAPLPGWAQEELLDEIRSETRGSQIFGTFNANSLINLPTSETAGKGEILLNFIHRFGEIGGARGGADALWGLDFVQDIRLGFYYGLTDRLHLGVSRTKLGRRFDFEAKYKLLRQRTQGMPFGATILTSAAIGTEPNDVLTAPPSNFETQVQRYPTFLSRVSYLVQVPLTRKIGSRLSVMLVPMWLHRNYITARLDENDLFALGVGTRLTLGTGMALTAEYIQNFSPYRLYEVDDIAYYMPLSLGFEVVAGGHVFQLTVSNTSTLAHEFLVSSPTGWNDTQMRMGFNIVRSIGVGKRKKELPGDPIYPSGEE